MRPGKASTCFSMALIWFLPDLTMSSACASRCVHPITAMHPCLHLLRHVATVLFALERTLSGHDGFDKRALWRVPKLEVQAFNVSTAQAEGIP